MKRERKQLTQSDLKILGVSWNLVVRKVRRSPEKDTHPGEAGPYRGEGGR